MKTCRDVRTGACMKPEISVLVRTKNRPLLLHRCLSSILTQEQRQLELVVVNDGGSSAEVDAAIARACISHKVNVIHLEAPVGPARALNVALDNASGIYIAIHDD